MDAKPTEIDLFHILKSKQINFIATRITFYIDLKSLKLCNILKSFMISIFIIFLRNVK